MKIVKLGFISLVIFCLLIFSLSLIFPSHIRVSRAVNINASADSVHALVTDLRNWKNWNELTISTEADTKFMDSAIRANQFKVTRLSVEQDTMRISWKKQSGRITEGGFTWYKVGNVIVVQWYFDFHLHWYPWEKFSSLLLENQVGVPMERSLDKLKKLAESNP